MEEKNEKKNDSLILENVFYGSNMSFYISRKLQKIAKAIYLVTSLIKDTEPLRFSMRQVCVDQEFLGNVIKDKRTGLELAQKLNNLISLLDIASIAHLVSPMNKDVLIRECEELQNLLLDQNFEGLVSSSIPSKYFNVDKKIESENRGFFKELVKDMEVKTLSPEVSFKGQNVLNKTAPVKVLSDSKIVQVVPVENQNIYKGQNQRKEQILSVIKTKGEVSIKDISVLVSGFSEKTIQRELNGLLADGSIKKTGERRWSRYSLSS